MTIVLRIIVIKVMTYYNSSHHLIKRLRSENRGVCEDSDGSEVKQIFSVGPIENTYYVIEASDDADEYLESEDGVTVPMYWSNEGGWVPYYFCDHFDEDDTKNYSPADGGSWKKVNSITNFVMAKSHYTVVESIEIEGGYGQN